MLYGNHNVKRLVVIDDYNALYWRSKYYLWKDINNKEVISGDQVTLVSANMVLLLQPSI